MGRSAGPRTSTFKDEAEGEGSRVEGEGSRIVFFIDYEFKSRSLDALMGSMFDVAFQKFPGTFERRADTVYERRLKGHSKARSAARLNHCFGAGEGIELLGSPLIAPARGASWCSVVCSVTLVRESGLMTIITGLPWESLARTTKDEGMMVISVNPAFVRSSRSFPLRCAGVCSSGVAFCTLVDTAESIAASAEPAKPEPRRRTNRVLAEALIGFSPVAAQPRMNDLEPRSFHSTR